MQHMSSMGVAVFAAIAMLVLSASAAPAAEPRPWLCRDKPVFSSDRPMAYELSASSSSEWHVFLMQFSPGGSHDGFDIVKVLEGPRRSGSNSATGHLGAGRYFAVGLYHNARGYWICPGYAHEQHSDKLGVISAICFAEDDTGCPLKLTVKLDNTTAGAKAEAR